MCGSSNHRDATLQSVSREPDASAVSCLVYVFVIGEDSVRCGRWEA